MITGLCIILTFLASTCFCFISYNKYFIYIPANIASLITGIPLVSLQGIFVRFISTDSVHNVVNYISSSSLSKLGSYNHTSIGLGFRQPFPDTGL